MQSVRTLPCEFDCYKETDLDVLLRGYFLIPESVVDPLGQKVININFNATTHGIAKQMLARIALLLCIL